MLYIILVCVCVCQMNRPNAIRNEDMRDPGNSEAAHVNVMLWGSQRCKDCKENGVGIR